MSPYTPSDLQMILLMVAARRTSGSLCPFPSAAGPDRQLIDSAVDELLSHKLVTIKRASGPAETWRQDGEDRLGLFLTAKARKLVAKDAAGRGQELKEGLASEPQPRPMPQKPAAEASSASTTKLEAVKLLLRRSAGATLDELMKATGWKPHSTRAALSGLRKKGHALLKDKRDDVTCYRIAGEE